MKSNSKGINWLKVLGLAAFVLVVYIVLAMVFTGWYTRHGQSIIVPKVAGMPLENANQLLMENDLEMVIIDSVYKEDAKPGTLVDQDPQFDAKVKPGRKIYVTLNTGVVPKVKMPKLINGSSNLAKVLLANSGLKLGRVDSIKSSFGPGLVIKQLYKGVEIPPNKPLDKGSIIDIVVSKKMPIINYTDSMIMKEFEEEPTLP
ncbi:MAG: PASTA domain-containing protein [Bacteroidia bacterium]